MESRKLASQSFERILSMKQSRHWSGGDRYSKVSLKGSLWVVWMYVSEDTEIFPLLLVSLLSLGNSLSLSKLGILLFLFGRRTIQIKYPFWTPLWRFLKKQIETHHIFPDCTPWWSQHWRLWINAYCSSIKYKQLFLWRLVTQYFVLKEWNWVNKKEWKVGFLFLFSCSRVEDTVQPGIQ